MSKPLTTTTALDDCVEGFTGLLPVDPFRSVRVHFGMLLGVDDFETIDAYHRGKMWLHNAWLHGQGVVWGLGVSVDEEAGEIRVERGLALDALGRELLLNVAACLNVERWLEEHRDDPDLELQEDEDGSVRFDAHVIIQFKPCLSRQVPALVEPCEGSGQTTAYSRVIESVELLLRPGRAPDERRPAGTLPYHRLRLLFSLEEPIEEEGSVIASDQEVLDRRDAILGLDAADRPAAFLAAFRDFAALDEIDLEPELPENGEGSTLFPRADPAPLVLADIAGLTLTPSGDAQVLSLQPDGGVDNTVRFAHVSTSTIQELLNGPLMGSMAGADEDDERRGGGLIADPDERVTAGTPDAERTAPADAGGPRVDPDSVRLTARQIAFSVDRELAAATVTRMGVSVTQFDEEEGWTPVAVGSVRLSSSGQRVAVVFRETPSASLVRLIARGTGPTPLLGADGVPLAGAATDPPASAHNGNDFVVMKKRS